MKIARILRNNPDGVTLIEILVGLVVLSIVSMAMFGAFWVVLGLQTRSSDEATALTLSQGFLEEIRSKADEENGFDSLEDTYSSDDMQPIPDLDHDEVGDFPGFKYNQRVEKISSEFKRAQSRVCWDHGGNRTGEVVLTTLIARPAGFLDGNIEGYVYDIGTKEAIPNAEVRLTWNGAGTGKSIGRVRTDIKGHYTFELLGGMYQIPPGEWIVSATAENYYDSTDADHYSSVICKVPAAKNVMANPIYLTPLPAPGNIEVHVMDRSHSNSPLPYIKLALYQNGGIAKDDNDKEIGWPKFTNEGGIYTYKNLRPGNYTVHTYDTYLKGYTCCFGSKPGWSKFSSGWSNYNPPYWHHGWSSVWPSDSKPADFSNYIGPPDNIKVNSGEVTLLNIYLDAIPRYEISGIVYRDDNRDDKPDEDYAAFKAPVYVRWWNNKKMKPRKGSDYSESDDYEEFAFCPYCGSYHLVAYSSGFIRNDSSSKNWNIMWSSYPGYEKGYPFSSSVPVDKNNFRVKVNYNNDTYGVHFLLKKLLPSEPKEYGNVDGTVRDYDDNSAVYDVTVKIDGTIKGGSTRQTNSNGYYNFATSSEPYPVSAGGHNIRGIKKGYYSYSGTVTVPTNNTVHHDFKMEKIGYGNISGRVTSLATGDGIAGATVTVKFYSGAPAGNPDPVQTDSSGYYNFATSGNPYPIVETRGSKKLHTISASADGYQSQSRTVEVADHITITENFSLGVDTIGF